MWVLSQANDLGGKNYFLAIIYFIIGGVSFFFAVVFIILKILKKKNRLPVDSL